MGEIIFQSNVGGDRKPTMESGVLHLKQKGAREGRGGDALMDTGINIWGKKEEEKENIPFLWFSHWL